MKTYPIVETFYSLQGEGYWTGTPMYFIRLAGCSVGGKSAMCTPLHGESFLCDTDYSCRENLTVNELLNTVKSAPADHVCITGGEPFDHDLAPLIKALEDAKLQVHIETSGTKEIDLPWAHPWITVSPKKGVRTTSFTFANEIKVLVSSSTSIKDIQSIDDLFHRDILPYKYLQPVTIYHKTPNGPREYQPSDNLKLCISLLLHNFPTWRLSLQTHNITGVR